jgi:hypothetical protein
MRDFPRRNKRHFPSKEKYFLLKGQNMKVQPLTRTFCILLLLFAAVCVFLKAALNPYYPPILPDVPHHNLFR